METPSPPLQQTVTEQELRQRVIETIRTIYDPEIPVNIYDLGLIYDIEVSPSGVVSIKMTLTAPGCPTAISLPLEVQDRVKTIEGVTDATVEVVWDPPWSPDRMSEEARLMLGIF
jgi:FeS assembly SUF system protein